MIATALRLAAEGALACTAVAYGIAVRRLAVGGRRWPARRSTAFGCGLAAVWVAVGSPLAAYDDRVVTAHVTQHLLLMMAAPPLLVLGQPMVLASQAAGRRGQVRLVRLMRGPLRTVTNPVTAWVVYLGSMYVMLADRSVYAYLIRHQLLHDASHAWLLAVGAAYWETLLGLQRRLSQPARVMSLLANMPFEVVVGIWLRYQTQPLVPGRDLRGTQDGGEAFIVGATVLSTLWLSVIVSQWAAGAWREERRARQQPVSVAWSTPWWLRPSPLDAGSRKMQQVPDAVDPPG